MCTNLAVPLKRPHCCLEQHQWQSETPFLICADPPGNLFQVLDHADNRVKRGHIAGFQQIEQQLFRRPVDRFLLFPR